MNTITKRIVAAVAASVLGLGIAGVSTPAHAAYGLVQVKKDSTKANGLSNGLSNGL